MNRDERGMSSQKSCRQEVLTDSLPTLGQGLPARAKVGGGNTFPKLSLSPQELQVSTETNFETIILRKKNPTEEPG